MQQSHNYRLSQLAEFISAQLQGDPDCVITSIAPLDKAQNGEISFLEDKHYLEHLSQTKASAVILRKEDTAHFSGNALIVSNPYAAYAKLSALFNDAPLMPPGIHQTAIVGDGCQIDKTASIGAYCVLGNRVKISDGVVIGHGCIIGDDSEIGANTYLHSRVTFYHRVKIGERVIIHSGVVIGADGFGFANDKGHWCKIYQIGGVNIGSDVEIGANTTIDRGAIFDTIIEDGVKLDNHIQIAHNVRIGAHTAMAGCTAVAGSTTIGKHCMIGGFSCFNGHIDIADGVSVMGNTAIMRSLTEPGIYASSFPATPEKTWWRIVARVMKMDDLFKRLRALEKKLESKTT